MTTVTGFSELCCEEAAAWPAARAKRLANKKDVASAVLMAATPLAVSAQDRLRRDCGRRWSAADPISSRPQTCSALDRAAEPGAAQERALEDQETGDRDQARDE